MEEYQAKKSCRSTPSEPYVPFFQSFKSFKKENEPPADKKEPPPPLPAPRKHKESFSPPTKDGYDNQGMWSGGVGVGICGDLIISINMVRWGGPRYMWDEVCLRIW